ncbi:hypothetical protein PHYBLDRAFT_64425 [Phycomyces blakesleeanus NRRL 1555(-)]|uniref:Uncharacterized protein n=1 Tax=Phycomyces blakesleeanus (strain ATCC 8743b / DSM 1359 / FGSC 10004 / NBRC 33097 / NRRL 1555) TaxID=763407 RepID=A0A167NAM2_PHYB8|nr:hypothetical protein PHYBLDRAFT_64425 [Phycomyces blakesleeanus NRRL 1555(-)]OAD75509.1 hypothetical protein PHYBLDRAFT_64425 [Phycomyces blakesleeanus NRRL 1555(-)]|eukprot:XP_018293549.1 hypothetical protein PHYBLDRAFT_64425 [Phycomyces blakesleeanus NRRL 1555(-)]
MDNQSSLSVHPLSIPPLSYVMASTYTSEVAKQYLIAQDALYPRNHIIFTCSGGSSMDYIFEKDRDYSYRCSEVNSMEATCCKRERKSERLDSFFAQRHLSYDIFMQGIYYWLNQIPRMTIGVMLGVSPETIRHLIASIHQLIQMDLTNNDMRIDKFIREVLMPMINPLLLKLMKANLERGNITEDIESVEWNKNEPQGQIVNKTNGAMNVDGIHMEKKNMRTDCGKEC